MKKAFLFFGLFLFPSLSYGVLSSTTTWEVRTTGNDANGACFDSNSGGVDYSQQDAAQYHPLDLATSGAGSTTLESATAGFTSNMVGNCIKISSGTNFQAGRYQITSFFSSTSVVLDATPSSGGAGADGVGRVGGAAFSPGEIGGQIVAGNDVWLKYGTYTTTTTAVNVPQGTVSRSAIGTATLPIRFMGYDVTRGDKTGNRPTFAGGPPNGQTLMLWGAGLISNIILDGRAITADIGINYGGSTNTLEVDNVQLIGFQSNAIRNGTSSSNLYLYDVEVTSCTTNAAIALTASGSLFIVGSNIHDNTVSGVSITGSAARLIVDRTLFDTNKNGSSGNAIVFTLGSHLIMNNSTIYNSGSHGIDLQSNTTALIANSIFESNGGYGINLNASDVYEYVSIRNSGFFSNTSGTYDSTKVSANQVFGNITNTTGTFFTDAANADFSLNNTADQGATLRSIAFPTSYPGASTNSYDDIGAARHQDPASGTTTIFNILE